ncbi:MAG: cupin domain-containing protein [Pseudomonadota bacterium]
MLTHYDNCKAYQTKDGSTIRELMHPQHHGNHNQSLAEAVLPVGTTTLLHRHHHSEELYYITSGKGLMTLDNEQFAVSAGDTITIPPGTPHSVKNTGNEELKILCCCAPPYSHDDTELL